MIANNFLRNYIYFNIRVILTHIYDFISSCPVQPRHMSVAINNFLYHLPYDDIFGGVSAMTVEHFKKVISQTFEKIALMRKIQVCRSGSKELEITKLYFQVNGFSNLFWGWGGEDDDMSNRIRINKLYISRYPANIARYFP